MQSFKGKKGYIMFSSLGETFFRVYTGKGDFKDYAIKLAEIEVTIEDTDAFCYNDSYIDYSPETLG